jgi:hypothetical protein
MSNIFGVIPGEICVADFLDAMRFRVLAESGLGDMTLCCWVRGSGHIERMYYIYV